jgi:hypothetical protein
MTAEVYIAVTMSDGSMYHVAYQCMGRGFKTGQDGWSAPDGDGYQVRPSSDALIEALLRKTEREQWVPRHGLTMVSWRRMSDAEHDMCSKDRPGDGSVYRNALVDRGGTLEYDMDRARECHKHEVRRRRGRAMVELDGQFTRAIGQGDRKEQVRVEVARQQWRDAPQDPRIAAARTVDELRALLP